MSAILQRLRVPNCRIFQQIDECRDASSAFKVRKKSPPPQKEENGGKLWHLPFRGIRLLMANFFKKNPFFTFSKVRKHLQYLGSSTLIPSTATTPMWSTTSWSSTSTSGGGDLFFFLSEMIFQAPALHEKRARWTVWICGHCQQHRSHN